jgi:hypothetical protein
VATRAEESLNPDRKACGGCSVSRLAVNTDRFESRLDSVFDPVDGAFCCCGAPGCDVCSARTRSTGNERYGVWFEQQSTVCILTLSISLTLYPPTRTKRSRPFCPHHVKRCNKAYTKGGFVPQIHRHERCRSRCRALPYHPSVGFCPQPLRIRAPLIPGNGAGRPVWIG